MKKFRKSKWAVRLGTTFIHLLAMTLRMRVVDEAGFLQKMQRAHLFAFWHNRILMMPQFYRQFFGNRDLSVMISPSEDGQLIAKIIENFGIQAIRGSSFKKPLRAFRQLLKILKSNTRDVGVTPDGPRGPRYEVQPGVLLLSQMCDCPIVPLSCHYDWKIELKSWDGFQIPLPFSRGEFHVLKPIQVPRDADKDEMERLRAELKRVLGE